MDRERVRAFPGFLGAALVPAILGRLLRRRAFRAQGRIPGDRNRAAAADFPQLVPPAISARLRDVPLRAAHGGPVTPRLAAAVPVRDADFADELAADLRSSLVERPRRIPSRYLYDSLGSALFDAICELPWYRITRAEMRRLKTHAPHVWSATSPLDRIIELGAGDGRKLAVLLSGRPRALATPRIDLVDISAT